jgi:hypothetical protein
MTQFATPKHTIHEPLHVLRQWLSPGRIDNFRLGLGYANHAGSFHQ